MSKSEGQVLDFEKICRLCLLEKRSMSSIFSKKKSDKKVPLPVRIMSCASLELYEGDGLPASICSKCLLSVNQSYAFREQCEQADTTLRQYAQRMNEASGETSANRELMEGFAIDALENGIPNDGEECSDSRLNDAIKDSIMICKKRGGGDTVIKKENIRQSSPESSVLQTLSAEKAENVIIVADVPTVLENKGCTIDSIANEGGYSVGKNVTHKCGLKSKQHLELLQNLMKNKNIIIQKRTSSKKQDFSKSLGRKKNYLNVAQLLREWEVTKQKDAESDCVSSVDEQQENAKPKWKNAKDTVYCKDCGIFLLRSSYNNHIKFVHKKIRKYLCQTCGYAACTGTILRQHVQAVHVGYSFFCDQCPKKFNLLKRLRKHVETQHSGKPIERNHVCQYCGMTFSKHGCLKRHLRSHTQETPYECQYCQRRFKYRWPKVQHERLHTGEKPYKCSYCDESFTQNCVRKAHEYKKHGNEEFKPKSRVKEEICNSEIESS